MKKHFLIFPLLLCFVLTTPALAVSDSLDNFQSVRSYAGQFTDVADGSTFYDNIRVLYEYGLAEGRADDYFGVNDSVTVGQAVIFAGRIRSVYRTGDSAAGSAAYLTPDDPIYLSYLRYLQAEGVIGTELDGTYGQAATRAQVAHILANVLPSDVVPDLNSALVSEAYATGQFIHDVTAETPYQQDILTLYDWGICIGSDSTGTFYPDSSITRGALSAMLTRLVQPSLRLSLNWNPHVAAAFSYGELVPYADSYNKSPETETDMDTAVRYMLCRDEYTLSLQYNNLTTERAGEITQLAVNVVKNYCEQGYNTVHSSYSLASGNMILTFSASWYSAQENQKLRKDTFSAALNVQQELYQSGKLSEQMTQYDKAKVYFDWICQNCTYDYSAGDGSASHLPYALFQNGTAVCDGYTGAYNLLLKLDGIDCSALPNDSHIWTVAVLDGTSYHIDTTWADSNDLAINYNYFAMTEEESRKVHNW